MVGQNIGKYRVLDRIGRGGMGTVYRAVDETLHREVAIKVLNAELNDPEVAKRFRAEAITVARLSHPGIATIYELFQHDGQWLMVMEYVRGETLERLVERAGQQTPEKAAELCMQSLAALAHAHSMGVVHRDLKPANIMLTETGSIKIMDFGIARVAGTEHLTNAGFMMGTPAYMAPEQVLGHDIDARADLYAMGVVFYRLLTAQLPFKGETPFAMAQAQVNYPPTPIGTVRADLPPWVDVVMTRSLAKKPEERFQSAVEFHEGFARSLAGQPTPAAYNSSAPTSLMMTPARALPTGAVDETFLSTPRAGTASMRWAAPAAVSSGSVSSTPAPSGVAPTIVAATPAALERPATGSMAEPAPSGAVLQSAVASPQAAEGPPSSGIAATVNPSGAIPSGTFGVSMSVEQPPPPGASGALPVPHDPAPLSQVPANPLGAGRKPDAKQKSRTGLLAAAALIVVVVGVGGFVMLRPRPASPPAEVPPVEATAPAAAEGAPPIGPPATTAPPPASTSAAAQPSPNATNPPTSPPRAGTAAPSAARGVADPSAVDPNAAGRRGDGARGLPTDRRGGAPVEDSLLAVADMRVLVIDGRKSKDEEIILNFGDGKIVLVGRRSGTPVATLPYRSIAAATYVRARNPRWNAALASPPDDLDVGGLLRTAKHWLTLQTKDGYQVLRLEDANVLRVLQAVEARTGLTIERPTPNDRN